MDGEPTHPSPSPSWTPPSQLPKDNHTGKSKPLTASVRQEKRKTSARLYLVLTCDRTSTGRIGGRMWPSIGTAFRALRGGIFYFLFFIYIFFIFYFFYFFYWDGFSRLQRWLSLRSCRWQEAVKAATTCPQNSKQKSHRYTSGDPPHHFHVHWSIGLIARRSGHSCLENNNNNCTRDRNPLKNCLTVETLNLETQTFADHGRKESIVVRRDNKHGYMHTTCLGCGSCTPFLLMMLS